LIYTSLFSLNLSTNLSMQIIHMLSKWLCRLTRPRSYGHGIKLISFLRWWPMTVLMGLNE